jgi:hypothetical protein
MSKLNGKTALLSDTQPTSREEAFELIELAMGDVSSLADAFNIIAEACGAGMIDAPETEEAEPCVVSGLDLIQ